MDTKAQVDSASRSAFAFVLYRHLISLALLVVGFITFPDRKLLFALVVVAFNNGVSAIIETQNLLDVINNRRDDLAERKTRHTILLAHTVIAEGGSCYSPNFWADVDDRVREEFGEGMKIPTPWWRTTISVILKFGFYIIGDLVFVGIALAISAAIS